MKILIDIPDTEYQMFTVACNHGIGNTAMERILNGVPLEQYGALQEIRQEINKAIDRIPISFSRDNADDCLKRDIKDIFDKHIKEIEE